jgi:hypothetical protein
MLAPLTQEEPITQEESHKILAEAVARARRAPPRFDRIAPPLDLKRWRAMNSELLREAAEEEREAMRRDLRPSERSE